MTAAEWTEFAEPLPRPPPCKYENFSVHQSLSERPDLFRIVSPIKVEVLEELLKTHPNKVFITSVMDGLRYGFWLWATTNKEGYPTTHDESKQLTLTEEKESFLRKQLVHEQSLGRISEEVGVRW